MPSYQERRNESGLSVTAQVRIKPFQPSSKTFHERDFQGEPKQARKSARNAAVLWAEDLEKTLRQQRSQGTVRADLASLTVSQLVDAYLKDPKAKALATYDERERQALWWTNKYGTTRACEFSNPILLRGARDMLSALHQPATVNRYLAVARHTVRWGVAAGLLPSNTAWPPLLMLPEPKERQRYLTDDELGRALKHARTESTLMYAATTFAIGVGCRQSELLRVKWGDIDERTHTVAISVTKTDTSRRAHLPPAVLVALKGLLDPKIKPLPGRHVFLDSRGEVLKSYVLIDAWQRIRKAAGLQDVRWHDLRHASALFLIQNGASLPEVAAQLGHKNVATSKRYAHLVPGAKPTGADALNSKLSGK